MIIGQTRGTFPKLHPDGTSETPNEKRERWEQWLIDTHELAIADSDEARHRDPELSAVLAQPNHNKAMTRPSRVLAIRSRCWQCQSGDDDDGGRARIADCESSNCALHSVRPYQDEATKPPRTSRKGAELKSLPLYDHAGKALANPGSHVMAVKGYCHQCVGGQPDMTATREVRGCAIVTCGLWKVRPIQESKLTTSVTRLSAGVSDATGELAV